MFDLIEVTVMPDVGFLLAPPELRVHNTEGEFKRSFKEIRFEKISILNDYPPTVV